MSMFLVLSCVVSSLSSCVWFCGVLLGFGNSELFGVVVFCMLWVIRCIVIMGLVSLMWLSCFLMSCVRCFLKWVGVFNVILILVGVIVFCLCLCLSSSVNVVMFSCFVVS